MLLLHTLVNGDVLLGLMPFTLLHLTLDNTICCVHDHLLIVRAYQNIGTITRFE